MKLYHFLIASLFGMVGINSFADSDVLQMQKVGSWTNVVSFSINNSENHIVMTMLDADGVERAYESVLNDGLWSTPDPISTINDKCASNTNVGGLFMTADERRIYFHANYDGGIGGFDIYYVDKTADGWSSPVVDEDLCTAEDERYPSLIDGNEMVFFLKHQAVSNAKQEKKEFDRQSIFYSTRNPKGKWNRPLPTNCVLNDGFVEDVSMSGDGLTIFYSSRPERKKPARLTHSQMLYSNEWTLPADVVSDDSDYDYFSPSYAGGKLYFVHSNTKKRVRSGYIVSMQCPQKYMPLPTVIEHSRIGVGEEKKPVSADVLVLNSTTMGVVGRYNSASYDGSVEITKRLGEDFIVEVRGDGYSFASYQLDYKSSDKPQLPQDIVLFDTIQLVVSTYDSEIFRPLDSKVIAVRVKDKAVFRSSPVSAGRYAFRLPLGSDYNIIATSTHFAEGKFLFKLDGDVVFHSFEREMPLDPQKAVHKMMVVDAESKEPLSANVRMVNLNREENIVLQKTNASEDVYLRVGDSYDMMVSGVPNYSFHNRRISVGEDGSRDIVVELIPLRANTAIRLNNINFESASADLLPESYEELDNVVRLMNENPSLRFEISAHTDNVGSAKYNMMLSSKRAESVSNYLIESGIPAHRLEPKGYGMNKPLVPNDSEENKAQNRRVEFMLIEEAQ